MKYTIDPEKLSRAAKESFFLYIGNNFGIDDKLPKSLVKDWIDDVFTQPKKQGYSKQLKYELDGVKKKIYTLEMGGGSSAPMSDEIRKMIKEEIYGIEKRVDVSKINETVKDTLEIRRTEEYFEKVDRLQSQVLMLEDRVREIIEEELNK